MTTARRAVLGDHVWRLKKRRGMLLAAVVSDFLGNIKSPNYEELGEILLTIFGAMSCNMSVQV